MLLDSLFQELRFWCLVRVRGMLGWKRGRSQMTSLFLGQNIGVQESWSANLYDDFGSQAKQGSPQFGCIYTT